MKHCLKLGQNIFGSWVVTIDLENNQILLLSILKERNMFVVERFISKVVKAYGSNSVSTGGGIWYPPQACRFLKLQHHLHSYFEKSLVERTIQYIKDRTESFDDYFPCRLDKCKLKHVKNWLNLFVDYHNKELVIVK